MTLDPAVAAGGNAAATANPTPINLATPSNGQVYRAASGGGLYSLQNGVLHQTSYQDPSVAAALKAAGIDLNSIPSFSDAQLADMNRNQGFNVQTANPTDPNFANYFRPTSTTTTQQTVNTQPALPASPTQIAAAQTATQQQLAPLQGQNVTTQTNAQGNITSSQTQPLAQPTPVGQQTPAQIAATVAATGQQPVPQTQTPQQMSILDSLKMDLLGAQHQLTQMGATPNELSTKYNSMYEQLKGTNTPTTGGDAMVQMGSTKPAETNTSASQDFMQGYGAMNGAEKQLYDTIQTQLSTPVTTQSLTQEYAAAIGNANLPAGIPGESLSQEQLQLMDMQKIMDGSQDDIRAEITKAGGFATESQVQALTTARNKTLLKQASYLQQSMALKQDYIDHLMNFTEKDQAQVTAEVDRKLNLEKTQVDLVNSMQNAAQQNYQNIIKEGDSNGIGGYQALSTALAGNPTALASAEKTLGLPTGALSNQAFLSAMTPITAANKSQFVSASKYQQGGVFDPITGTFTPTGGGGNGTSSGTSTGAAGGIGGSNSAYYKAFANATIGVGPQSLPNEKTNFDSYMASGDTQGAKDYLTGLAIQRAPAQTQNALTARVETLDALTDISGLLQAYVAKSGDTNILKGSLEQAAQKVGQSTDPNLAYIQSRMQQALFSYRHGMTGVAFSPQEGAQYAGLFANISNSDTLNASKIASFRDGLNASNRSDLKLYLGGADVYDSLFGPPQTATLPNQTTPSRPGDLIQYNGLVYQIASDGDTLNEYNPASGTIDFSKIKF